MSHYRYKISETYYPTTDKTVITFSAYIIGKKDPVFEKICRDMKEAKSLCAWWDLCNEEMAEEMENLGYGTPYPYY